MTVTEPYVSRAGHVRWFVCALLFAVVALNYVDRQVLSVLKPTLQQAYGWSEIGYGDVVFWFQAAEPFQQINKINVRARKSTFVDRAHDDPSCIRGTAQLHGESSVPPAHLIQIAD